MAKELAVQLENKPGTLASLTEALGRAGVNIVTFAVVAGNRGNCRVVVEDAAAARKAIEGAGMRVESEMDVVTADLEDRAGALGTAARKLASAGVNIEAAYLTGSSAGKKTVVFSVSDAAKARSALG